MPILCGTDFSEPSQRALVVAARLAARAKTPLHLLHCAHLETHGDEALKQSYTAWAERQLDRRAHDARQLGAQVEVHLKGGSPDEALVTLASELHADLIVIGPLGGRSPGSFELGGHADKLAQRSHVPVLIIRGDAPFGAWLDGARPLRVVLGADLSHTTDAAMAFIERCRGFGACDVTAVHLYWPPQQFERLGLHGVRSYLDPDPDVTKTLTRELTHRLAPADEPSSIQVYVEPHLGRPGDRLADIAAQRGADLLVVGTHARSALGRVWEGSVSRWALHAARTSVVCVPAPVAPAKVELPRLRNVLAATDFSAAGNAAIGLAYALTEPGGTVHLAHVVRVRSTAPTDPHDIFAIEQSAKPDARREEVHTGLRALVPSDCRDRMTRVHVLESNEAGAAIRQAALRLDADAICLGRRGRTNLAQTLLGSVSKELLAHAERPVLLAPAPRE